MTETVSRPTNREPMEHVPTSTSQPDDGYEQEAACRAITTDVAAASYPGDGASDTADRGLDLEDESDEDVFVFPASFAQQRLWFLDQFEPNSPFYNIATAVRLRGPLQVPVLARTLNEIVRRHESLRTTFVASDGQPVQVIRPEGHVDIPLVDISSLPEAEREAEAQRLGNQEAQQPFDLTHGPLLRAKLLHLGAYDHVALLTMHHIISDGWSMAVLIHEITTIYTAFQAGKASPLPDLPIQYADYAQWQRDWLQGEVLQKQIDYWKKQLGDQPPILELPGDRPRPAVQSSRGGSASRNLDQSLADALTTLSQREGVTLFMTLLAAFQVLLARYSGQAGTLAEDICVGTPIANRTRGELEGLIGFFVNTLVLRTNLAGDPTFRELLQRVREVSLGAYAHQDLPFEMLVEAIQPERDMSHTPLFQVMFILQNAGMQNAGQPKTVHGSGGQATGAQSPRAAQSETLVMSTMDTETGTSTFDLTLSIAPAEDGLSASVEYSSDLFDRETIDKMLVHLETLLRAVVADPGQHISTLPLSTEAELRQMLVEWNDTTITYDVPERLLLVHELFDAQAKRTPEAIAVVHPAWGGPERRLTYRDLAERSDRLASVLVGLGVGPEALVGLCLERSPEMLVGVLGVLKAGGAYVPLDPSYPKERLALILEDAQVEVLVIQQHLLEAIPAPYSGLAQGTVPHDACVVLLEADQEPVVWGPVKAGRPEHRMEYADLNAENLAYLIFTSGSTGRPKGVMIEHGSIRNAYLAWEQAYELKSVRAHLQMASFSFDVFTGDWTRALCSGGTLVLAPRDLLLEPKALYDLLRREQIDCAEFVPVVLRSLMQYLDHTGQRLDFMRLVICGSDGWYVGEYRQFQRLCGPQTRLINSFGLTECTIDTTYFDGQLGGPGDTTGLSEDQLIPIGRPFANSQIFILDRQMQPTPIGVPGELYVGGLGLARGYLQVAGAATTADAGDGSGSPKRNAHTGGRFVPNPLADRPWAGPGSPSAVLSPRLYRTGDGARYRRDGNIEFLGRIDDQVKIRGYRIELGEVEATLNQHPDIQQSAVVVRSDQSLAGGNQRLVAYMVPVREPAPSAGALRRFMQERLPDYMVPSLFMAVPSIPVTPNGKIDRRGLAARPLPPLEEVERDTEDTFVAPRTPIEQALAGIWAAVLDLPADKISIHDNFFDLGGHSLLATQIASRARDTWQIDLPLRTLFEAPVLAALAEQIEVRTRQSAMPEHQAPPIRPAVRTDELPLSFAQQRLWFLDQLEPNSPFYNMPEVLRLTGTLDRNILEQSLNEVVRRHESLRTIFLTVDGKPRQVIAPMSPFHLPVMDLRSIPAHEREAEVERIVRHESQQPFNLARGPLWRVQLLRLDEQEHIFLLVTHHIITDDWSSNVFFAELATFYETFSRGGSWPMPDLPIQYADYAVWQRQWLQGEVLQAHLAYWETQLKGVPPLLEMPTDRPRPAVQTFAGDYQSFTLSEQVSAGFKAMSQREGVTLFMALLSAFQVLLTRYSGQEDICVGSPIANRTQRELEPLIGFFVNTLVLRGDLSGDPTFRQLLQRTREMALGAYAHQDLPFEMIVDKVQPQRDMGHSPLFQAMFVLRNASTLNTGLRTIGLGDGPGSSQQLPNLALTSMEAHSGTAKFDLTLFVVDEDEGLSGALEYNTDLFDAATIKRMLDHWQNLLQGIVANPNEHISQLPLMGEQERRRLLVEWNDTAYPYPAVCAHQLFETQAAKTPDAVAVTMAADPFTGRSERSLTYRELNRRANQLARYLQSQGVGPDVLVAVCARRTLELPVALLGILKAGGAYVPLDPTYPQERLAFMLGELARPELARPDSQAPILLTQTDLLEQLPSSSSRVVCLDSVWPDTAQPDTATTGGPVRHGAPEASFDPSFDEASYDDLNPTSDVTPDHLAYMIYTSGSTGKPKGALIMHRGLVNYLTWCLHAYPLEEGQGAPVHSSISFDLTVTSLFAPLVSGRQVKLLPEDLGVEALAEALRQEGTYSLVKITPAHLELLGQQLDPGQAGGCTRSFIIGGENLLVQHIAFWQSFAPDTVLVNEYGPTETVVGCCVYTVPPQSAGEGEEGPQSGSIPIGRPIINTQLYVLDPDLQPVPIGVIGELYIGGAGVARGYLNRPELTSERFLPDPFTADSTLAGAAGARIYKTGDLARYRADGNLECLGRVDNQVKIRGFRIELGEIEAVLSQHPGLSKVCVLAREDAPGARRLVAYVCTRSVLESESGATLQSAETLTANDVKAFLGDKLPEYMVPSTIVFLETLPLTSNGKVDRRALPAPEALRPDLKAEYVAPRSDAEETLARIWGEVLHLDRVGIYDSFFELGGDSILSIQVIARANQAGLRLAPKDLFQHPTIDGLASAAMSSTAATPVQAEQGVVSGVVPLTPIQQWFLEQELVDPNHWNQALLLQAQQRLDRDLLERAIECLIEHHDALRLRLVRVAPSADGQQGWQQINADWQEESVFSWVDLSAMTRKRQKAAIEAEAASLQASLDIIRGPLVRMAYFDLGVRVPGRLLIVVHHLAIDGISWGILLEDLQTAYQQLARRVPVQLLLKTTAFRDWANKLVQYADSESLHQELAYWEKAATGPIAGLPVDNARGQNVEGATASVTISLGTADTQALLHDVHDAYHTKVDDLMLTALAQALARWTRSSTIAFDLEGHGREQIFDDVDLSRTVGWFTTLYPIYVTLRNVNDPGDCLKMVKETLRHTRGMGYGLLRYLGPPEARRTLRSLPRAEISFNYLGQVDQLLGETWLVPAAESRGADRGPKNRRTHLVDVNGAITGGQLHLEWSYSEDQYQRATIERLAAEFKRALQELIAHCRSLEAGGFTPSDMADFGWGEEDLDDILRELDDMKDDMREFDDMADSFRKMME